MPNLLQRAAASVKNFFFLPPEETDPAAAPEPPSTVRRTIYDVRQSPTALASQMDVDQIHALFVEAENGDVTRLFALYRDILLADTHVQTEFGKRLLAVLLEPLSVQPADEKQALDAPAAEFVTPMKKVKGWLLACAHLLCAALWPVAVVEKVFRAVAGGYELAALVPVPFELLDFQLGRLRIRATNELGQPTGEFFEADPARYIVHRGHLLPVPDSWGGPFRALVFWWFFRSLGRGAWARFLERYGSPFLVGKYDLNDDDSRSVLERAFSRAAQLFGIVITRETEVEIQQAGAKDSGEAFEAFHATANREMSKLILGQTSSAEAQKTGGIGDGPSAQHETVRQDIRQFDAMMLGQTLVDQLAVQLLAINGHSGSVALVFGGESGEKATETAELLKTLKEAGFQVTEEDLPLISKRLGIRIERVAPPPAPTLPPAMPPGAPGRMQSLSLTLLALAAQALSGHALDRMPGDAPAGLARRFRGGAAPLRDLIDRASSPEEVLTGVRALSIGWGEGATADLLAEALLTYAANGTVAPL